MIETQWSTEEGDRQLLFAWIAGKHNLAHLHERQQQSEMALHFLKNAHEKVRQMSSNDALSYFWFKGENNNSVGIDDIGPVKASQLKSKVVLVLG
ncbi:hypothetical protein CXF83_18095 [Shewanella sp. Choline-02u-19]|uniref:hypothetical protein n=1 Tax=unclassified Shewanella TaxID=196818 RepID=UPI000C34F9CA|nr:MULTISPECIES: hypothetical protein [unclassified Shewanella]PKH57619.1 hypothetical protein CXF84_08350 [Shewanella sp. Bg11-22]PKI28481.1 hypothetical protein CXF83_18095 [Shewanella sp. Choline-02u-19]